MPGWGVRGEQYFADIKSRKQGAKEIRHISQEVTVFSQMVYRNENVPMGSAALGSEFETQQTDRKKVSACLM